MRDNKLNEIRQDYDAITLPKNLEEGKNGYSTGKRGGT